MKITQVGIGNAAHFGSALKLLSILKGGCSAFTSHKETKNKSQELEGHGSNLMLCPLFLVSVHNPVSMYTVSVGTAKSIQFHAVSSISLC